jgi:hypothetical protein
MTKAKILYILSGVLLIIIGWVIGTQSATKQDVFQVRSSSPEYSYTRPILFVDNSDVRFSELDPLKEKIERIVASAISRGEADDVGFYYRDMNTSQWTGVNENHSFAPSSMLKVTTLLAYLKHEDEKPGYIDTRVSYAPVEDPGQNYKPAHALEAGNRTLRELLQQMIIESDNSAMEVLDLNHIDDILAVYKELQLPNPLFSLEDFLSPLQYSRILRTLYNSSYVPPLYSEEALKLLTYTTFTKGLVAGVASTTIAHKFGEYTRTENNAVKLRELHDCGIVYYPKKPYLICVMTKGTDFPSLERIIANISKTVFEYKKNE